MMPFFRNYTPTDISCSDLWICVSDSFMPFGKINGAKANSLGRLFGRLSFLYVGVMPLLTIVQFSFLFFSLAEDVPIW